MAHSVPATVIATDRARVPCNGCRQCCLSDAVRLMPGDSPADYLTEPHQSLQGALMLAHKANGECVYLGPAGCTIHERSPAQCRTMDCRKIARALTMTAARKAAKKGLIKFSVWQKGKELARLG